MARLTSMALGLVLASTTLLASPTALSHEVRPAFLGLEQTGANQWSVTWKRPMRGDAVLKLTPRFPEGCALESSRSAAPGNALVTRAVVACDTPLEGRTLKIEGLSATMVDVLVRTTPLGGEVQSALLRGGNDTLEVAKPPTGGEVFLSFLIIGVEHILLGFDHLLFVLGLLLLLSGFKPLLAAITAFTLAHSVTLALASLGLVNVPGAPVEAVIALSIMFLASELLLVQRGEQGWTQRHPSNVSFIVGLLHGLGFAGALSEVGLPQSDLPMALLSFNLGVEAGQLAFVAIVLVGLAIGQKMLKDTAPARWAPYAAAWGIGGVAAFWVIERTVAFL